MLQEIKDFMEEDGNLAQLSLGEAAKVERYMKWLIEHCEFQAIKLEENNECGCNHGMFHIHTLPACTCGLGPEHCGCTFAD